MTGDATDQLLIVSGEVAQALAGGAPVVALESALLTHGLPAPTNLAVARAAEGAVRAAGAVPATVAILDGRLRVGLADEELHALAEREGTRKAGLRDLAAALVPGTWAGTTVSATIAAAKQAGIEVFATGGIGGVHHGGERSLDISADLDELGRTPLVVVCAGPKSILDLDRTLEVLETRGVPVVGYGTDELPGFLATGSGRRLDWRVDGPDEAAALYRRHRGLGLESSVLLCVPPPAATALAREEVEQAVARLVDEADRLGVGGGATTPWLLARLAELTGGRSLRANAAVIENDAAVAAHVAVALVRPTPAG